MLLFLVTQCLSYEFITNLASSYLEFSNGKADFKLGYEPLCGYSYYLILSNPDDNLTLNFEKAKQVYKIAPATYYSFRSSKKYNLQYDLVLIPDDCDTLEFIINPQNREDSNYEFASSQNREDSNYEFEVMNAEQYAILGDMHRQCLPE
ncbi:hypothetical protein TVAG_416160 [Trichomonas vaginalis G3]|uniref:Uncharacterized protein n=1 Tax=Trichomonas vaginalis (strain ATCC PRA-98 / G3) TaxID=412133 RepID=A2FQ47_TRIV3|nr:hypothetical protein TVAGG3_0748330 [Trichomonas vaginalis G3]EAX92954.1 hypothetical protein TVAG_416160 [Trichomonas vaginalis G3]KAI5512343.1 hypothetical protein TVAGG3_0748330 [Trichomonas vaginalis G3]|eukprot:XP_001305884.1 hypothetical protein [Trichomonas vaginalis G3]